MNKTFGAFALVFALIAGAGAGAASAMPSADSGFDCKTVFDNGNG